MELRLHFDAQLLAKGPARSRGYQDEGPLPLRKASDGRRLRDMRFDFTPAAQRALDAAAGWSGGNGGDELRVPQLLLGLLAEPECRSALLLARFGINQSAVQRRFPELAPIDTPAPARADRFAPELWKCLDSAERLLIDYPRPLSLATEHLLLGIAATEGEASRWLAECGLYADALEAEVHRLAGHQPGPLPLDIADDPPTFVRVEESPVAESAPDPSRFATGESLERDRILRPNDVFTQSPSPQPNEPLSPSDGISALRVIDAAANRASEGLRVIEDYVRFALDDRHLTTLCKRARHDLTSALASIRSSDRHAARDTQADVGTQVTLATEQVRAVLTDVVTASFKRVEQALRSLEEFCKVVAPASAPHLERLRYFVYTLERATDITQISLKRLADVRLYVLVDGGSSADGLRSLVESLVTAGVGAIQLRDKRLDDRRLLERAQVVRAATSGTPTLFIMNDRPDLALLSGADGVHVGQDELTVKDARRILGVRGLIGVSTHSIDQARAAVLDGANYIGVGPTFPSTTKSFAEYTGLELLRAVHDEIRLPAFAIGGITPQNLPQVLATGIERVAVSGAIATAADPGAAARAVLDRWS